MNKNVLAATRGLDESITLGRVEPLHSAFSHNVVSAGSKQTTNCHPRKPACPRNAGYAVWGKLDSLNDIWIRRKIVDIAVNSGFLLVCDDLTMTGNRKISTVPIFL